MRRSLSTLGLSLALAAPLSAATITVDTLADDFDTAAPCSLREAIQNATSDSAGRGCAAGSGADTIVFDASLNGQIALGLAELHIYDDLEIVATPAGRIGVRAAPSRRIFNLHGTISFRLQGLVLEGGRPGAEDGGAILALEGAQIEIADCVLRDHEAQNGGAIRLAAAAESSLPVLWIYDSRFENNRAPHILSGYGGAVHVSQQTDFSAESSPTVVIERSVFLDNQAETAGGAVNVWRHHVLLDRVAAFGNESGSFGGGLAFSGSSVGMLNSTLSLNRSGTASGLSVGGLDTGHSVRVDHATITGNVATFSSSPASGARFIADAGQAPIVLVYNSLLADNVGGPDCTGGYGFTTGGNNVFGDVTGCETPVASDLETVAPLVLYYGEMATDARDTFVALPSSSSPVVDRIAAADCDDLDGLPLVEDQRGGVRPKRAYVPLPGSPPAACDSGALERGFVEFALWIFKDGFESGNLLQWSVRAQ